ncbi:phytoene desaturase family protein [Paenibacillus thalictri]|uniref:NAD(P)/FAD-dependent oxidoreductase n=1 Tax=Paenibacillus thalictri TaxID=2527873 RepID=A0A4Q9E0H6_9BACL|nr:NAD(P)/FAD-dependent oxidoreductase [Paenibacillus thalictri]TBL81041.1 NAD(P)/FAD-dependent oxidoreductase [Paenibacillus thalictri]
MEKWDVAVVGGGMAGLTAAVYAAKAGKRTVVLEKQERLGGRAMTNRKQGAYFNLGGHALFDGDALATFRELGVRLQGNRPSIDAYGIWKDKLNVLPTGIGSLLATPLLTWRGKMEFALWLAKFGRLDTQAYDRISLREWLEAGVQDPMVRNIMYSLLRTASYVAAPDLQAAGPVLRHLKNAMRGVLYLDRGWGAMIDELRRLAAAHGVRIMTGSQAVSVEHIGGVASHIVCDDGAMIQADHIILACPPDAAYKLVPHADATRLRVWKEQAIEVTAACLDVALRRLPQPEHQLVYGIDQTIFLSNHSRAAYLSDDGAQVVSLIKYHGTDKNPQKDLHDLEHALDLSQPGWRNEVVEKQYLPNIAVCCDFPHIRRQAAPGPDVPEIAGLYVAGEWASHGELLADAATASAKRAVSHILLQESIERTDADDGYRNVI